MRIYQEGNRLVIAEGKSAVWIEPWGANSLRVRMSAVPQMDANDWALTEKMEDITPQIAFEEIDVTDPWYRGERTQNTTSGRNRRVSPTERSRQRCRMRDGSRITISGAKS